MKPFGLVCPFFGGLPIYFPLFADSCRKMPQMDFHILTDAKQVPRQTPPNVKVHTLTLDEYKSIAEKELGVEVRVDFHYKIADHKPMWGVIFRELLEDYEYWGFCDIDQIFSEQMFEFIDQGRTRGADIINTHSIWTHGPLMLFRNDHEFRNFFRKSKDWQRALKSPELLVFDECGSKYDGICKLLGTPLGYCHDSRSFLDLTESQLLELQNFQCLTSVVAREYHEGRCRVHQASLAKENLLPQELLYINEQGIRDNSGVWWSAYHWVHDKKRRKFHYPKWRRLPPRVYVTQYGFFNADTPYTNRFLWLYRFLRGGLHLLADCGLYALGRGPDPRARG